MCRRRSYLIYAFALLVTLFTISCSQPAENAGAEKTSQAAPAEASTKGDAEAVRVEQPKPVEEVKKKPAEPVRVAPAPRPSAPAPSPAPVSSSLLRPVSAVPHGPLPHRL